MKWMRLDRYLATYAGMTRKEARDAVRKGRVSVGGTKCLQENYKVAEPSADNRENSVLVCLDGEIIDAEKYVYYMLHKPQGVLSATKDSKERTVLDLIETGGRDLFPVGRLDKDTEGLLLLTDDGELSHKLLSPKYHVEKVYEVHYEGELPKDAILQMEQGLDIGEKRITKPAVLELYENNIAHLTITEGKFHQVKRMFACLGTKVTYLKRLEMAGIALDVSLKPGEYRKLTEKEVQILNENCE